MWTTHRAAVVSRPQDSHTHNYTSRPKPCDPCPDKKRGWVAIKQNDHKSNHIIIHPHVHVNNVTCTAWAFKKEKKKTGAGVNLLWVISHWAVQSIQTLKTLRATELGVVWVCVFMSHACTQLFMQFSIFRSKYIYVNTVCSCSDLCMCVQSVYKCVRNHLRLSWGRAMVFLWCR